MTLLLLDTLSAFFRAHHALPPMTTRSGEPTAALYGFSALLLKLLREHPHAALAFAVDRPEATFRKDAFDGYKAQREPTTAPFRAQLDRLSELLDALAVPVLGSPGFEADDVLATLARKARERGEPSVTIVSGDRDALQLARDPVRVVFIGRRGQPAVIYDEAAVEKRFGVEPARLPTYVALVGDPSDNLPGVPGIGAVTARKLASAFPDASALLQNLDRVEPQRLRESLRQHASQILLTERLARLRDDVPLPEDEALWAVPSPAALERLRDVFVKLEFQSLLPRIDKLIAAG